MRFLADMGVSRRVVNWLNEQGHEAAHLLERGLQSLTDEEVFGIAISEGRVVLTFDLDFGEIVAHQQGRNHGVILFRLNDTTTPFLIKRLRSVLADAADALNDGAIVVVEDSRHRTRRFE